MTRVRFLLVFCAMVIWTPHACAYEIQTHEQVLTREGANRSVLLTDPRVLRDLGITDSAQRFPDSTGDERTIRGLIEVGSRFEDDILPVVRVTRHFYNPITGQGLSLPALPTQTSSPDWSLTAGQEFSYLSARQYLLDALTRPGAADRKRAFGLTFQTLGHVVHHLQDMAQPQHVRNDVHCHLLGCLLIGAFAPSLYESWTNRADVRGSLPTDPGLAGYNITSPLFSSTFNSPRRFWHTESPGQGSMTMGKGIAEFTNRNFVSAGTNFDKPGLFSSPVRNESSAVDMDIQQLCANANPPCQNPGLTGVITFYGNTVEDRFTGRSTNNPFASSLSIFDADLRGTAGTPLSQPQLFTLNRFNFALAHAFLTPRAVAYSAGLINYFFRGRLDAEPVGPGTMLVKNLSPEEMQGSFGLYYDDALDVRQPVNITACRVGETDVPVDQGGCAGATLAAIGVDPKAGLLVTFDAPGNAKNPGEYMLVFNGRLGEEAPEGGSVGAVAGKLVSNPYNGVLYVAGENSAGQVLFFKVDKSGISMVPFGQRGPFQSVSNPGIRERAYHFKQVEFTTTPAGSLVHRTVGLALRGNLGDQSQLISPATGSFGVRQGIWWVAKSPDPAIGSFEFRLGVTDASGRQAELTYTRRFTDTDGVTRTSSGVMRLPTLPSNAGFIYPDFLRGGLMLNGDGTAIYPRGTPRHGIRITLTVIPSAALFDLPQPTSSSTSNPAFSNFAVTGQCSISYVSFTGAPATRTSQLVRQEQLKADSESVTSSIRIVDFLRGDLLTFEERRRVRNKDYLLTESCQAGEVDYALAPQLRVKVNLRLRQQAERIARTTVEYALREGMLQDVTDSVSLQPETAITTCAVVSGPSASISLPFAPGGTIAAIDYAYEGFGPCPSQPVTIIKTGSFGTPKQRMRRPLTDRSIDAVYVDVDVENNVELIKFRNEVLPAGSYLADASPIGEVFLATPDMSVLVHEPKPGNMPVLTRESIPGGIVRLLAAIWM